MDGPWEPTLQSLSLESALDDLDLNEFGVAALEKTFDNSAVPHPSSITIGTGCGWPGWPEGHPGGPPAPTWLAGPHLARPLALSSRWQFVAELRACEHPWFLRQLSFLPLCLSVPSRQPLLTLPAAAPGPLESVRKHVFGDLSITWIIG